MKTFHFKIIVLLFLLHCSTFLGAIGPLDHEIKKSYSKEFACDKATGLEISNRYGNVDVKTWQKAAIKIDVVVTVKAGTKSAAEDKMNEISIKIEKNGNNVVGITEIGSQNSSWWSSWSSFGKSASMTIHYNIYIPEELRSIIENKYGNIFLADIKGKTSINLKYGNLQAKNIDNDLLLDLSYGNAIVGAVKNLSGTLAYSDYRGTSSNQVNLTTKYSKVNFDNINTLTATSKYDGYNIGTAGTITLSGSYGNVQLGAVNVASLNTKYTGIEIASLNNSLASDLSYGSLKIENLKTTLKGIRVNTSYAPVKIYGSIPCKVDIKGKYFTADLGSDFIYKHKVAEGSSKEINGFKTSERTSVVITISTSYGDIIIK